MKRRAQLEDLLEWLMGEQLIESIDPVSAVSRYLTAKKKNTAYTDIEATIERHKLRLQHLEALATFADQRLNALERPGSVR